MISELEGPELEALICEADFEGPLLSAVSRSEVSIELLDPVVLEGQSVHRLELIDPDFPKLHYYICCDTYRMVRKDVLDQREAFCWRPYFRDYREVSGFPFPFEIENKRDGQPVSRTRITDVKVNPGQLSFFFRKPTY